MCVLRDGNSLDSVILLEWVKFPIEGGSLALSVCLHVATLHTHTHTQHYYTPKYTLTLDIKCLFYSHSPRPHPWLQCSWKCVPHFWFNLSISLFPSFLPICGHLAGLCLSQRCENHHSWTFIDTTEVTKEFVNLRSFFWVKYLSSKMLHRCTHDSRCLSVRL